MCLRHCIELDECGKDLNYPSVNIAEGNITQLDIALTFYNAYEQTT